MMISSNAPPSTSCFTAANGSLSPMAPSTSAPAALSSNGRASSSVVAASSVSGSKSLLPRRGLSRPTLAPLGASRAGETHRAERAYDHLNVLDAPHPWTIHRDRGAVAWRLNPQPAPRDQRGGATRRSRDRWRLLRLELLRLLRVAPQHAASRAALRPWAGIPPLALCAKGSGRKGDSLGRADSDWRPADRSGRPHRGATHV